MTSAGHWAGYTQALLQVGVALGYAAAQGQLPLLLLAQLDQNLSQRVLGTVMTPETFDSLV